VNHSIGAPWHWAAFLALVLTMLALDLGVFHRKAREVTLKEAAAWSGVWVALAACFNVVVYLLFGAAPALEFATGYVIEKALAVDNIFVFVLIFSAFSIPLVHQHRVLFWGILGALALRAVFVVLGGAFLAKFHWAIYVFGTFLAITGVKLLLGNNQPETPSSPIVSALKRWIPVTENERSGRFLVKTAGKWSATPLLLALFAVEISDVVFAVDSIPAIFAITKDPFIVFTSNIFAILGLRSLYFLLAGVLDRFVYLKTGLALVLVFVGAKMLLSGVVEIPVVLSLAVIVATLATAMIASWFRTKRDITANVGASDGAVDL
jgi:tellurite resistance protein TerC